MVFPVILSAQPAQYLKQFTDPLISPTASENVFPLSKVSRDYQKLGFKKDALTLAHNIQSYFHRLRIQTPLRVTFRLLVVYLLCNVPSESGGIINNICFGLPYQSRQSIAFDEFFDYKMKTFDNFLSEGHVCMWAQRCTEICTCHCHLTQKVPSFSYLACYLFNFSIHYTKTGNIYKWNLWQHQIV